AVARVAAGEKINVAQVCRETGVSRAVFYVKLERFKAEGSAGLAPRSRAPHSRPSTTAEHVGEAVVRARKELADEGWDNGAITIRWRLLDIARSGEHPTGGPVLDPAEVPSRATVHRILVERGQVVPQPRKRPKAGRRFVHPA
ncbi:leucine zipper domain-containing protein, partial [Actinomycetospora sp. OC33-EN08]